MPEFRVPMMESTFGVLERQAMIEVLESGMVTQGVRVREFERRFKDFLGSPVGSRALMVNSGSSANLIAARLLRDVAGLADGEHPSRMPEVITPAVTWSTTVAPLIQHGFKPVFVDVGDDLQVDPARVADAVTEETVAIAPVHLAGWPADMTRIMDIANSEGLYMWEDACESLGAKWKRRPVGTFGGVGTFSFYMSHHLSACGEGGMVLVPSHLQRPLAWREHGWTRGYNAASQVSLAASDEFLDSRWVFSELGYNLRSTELNAAVGLVQLGRQAGFMRRRQEIALWYEHNLQSDVFEHLPFRPEAEANPFSYPILITKEAGFDRRHLAKALADAGVDSRPPMTGNITRHPYYKRNTGLYRVHGGLDHADAWHERGILLPVHPLMTQTQLDIVKGAIDDFLKSVGNERSVTA